MRIAVLCFLLSVHGALDAQVCSGSLGDPVVNVDFGKGSNPGARLTGTVTNYNYIAMDCPSDGNYTVANSTYSCFGSTWHNVGEDHTPGDVDGYMMVANASFVPGDFYVDTVRGLCPNTVYEFASWILNLSRPSSCAGFPIKPNLTFRIETTAGVVISVYNTGLIDYSQSPDWRQYGVFFTTPATVSSVVLRLTNNSVGGCGNDLALDDITFRPCGPTIRAAFINSATTLLDTCEGQPVRFDMSAAVSAGYANPAYQWQRSVDSGAFLDIAGATLTRYGNELIKPGSYRYRLAIAETGNIGSSSCRIFSNILTLNVNPLPRIDARVNKPVCAEAELALGASGGGSYAWTGPRNFVSQAATPRMTAATDQTGMYYVEVISPKGCRNRDSVHVLVFPKASASAGPDQTICEGSPAQLNGSAASSYLWAPGRGLSSPSIRNPMASPVDTTTYLFTVTDQNGCKASDSLRVSVLKKPVADAGSPVQVFEGQSATLRGSVSGTSIRYVWDPASFMTNAGTLSPTVTPTDNTTYTLRVFSDVGCGTAEDKVFVQVFKQIVIPNAFSPNGDGINDEWNIEHLQTYTRASVNVFNRFGQPVYSSTGYARKWNGTLNGRPLPSGTYYYTINLADGSGVKNGWVLLVR